MTDTVGPVGQESRCCRAWTGSTSKAWLAISRSGRSRRATVVVRQGDDRGSRLLRRRSRAKAS